MTPTPPSAAAAGLKKGKNNEKTAKIAKKWRKMKIFPKKRLIDLSSGW
ncbi:MAG: hypothetical protein AB7V14_10245 [Kiritimatiellia bacterium]